MLSALIFFPLALALLMVFVRKPERVRTVALSGSLFYFLMGLGLFCFFEPLTRDMQLVERASWLPFFGVQYFVGVDGLSFWFVLLSLFLTPVSVLAAWNMNRIRAFLICVFLMTTSVMGTFLALDGVLFYLFFESSLIPLYFMIGIWGGKERVRAAFQFFIYTAFGSMFLLAGLVAFMHLAGGGSGGILDFYAVTPAFVPGVLFNQQNILFFCFFIPFAIKLPLVPFHTWLPLAHGEAPTVGSAWLAAVILKMGAYGFFRFVFPLFPDSLLFFSPFIAWLAAFGILYGALMALAQKNMKRLVAYSSVSHMGYIVLGLVSGNIYGMTGAFYQGITHAVSSAALFLMVGMLFERRRSLMISDYGGWALKLPVLACFFVLISLSAIALPGTGGFISEFFVLIGTFFTPWWSSLLIVIFTIVITAALMLYLIHRVFLGPLKEAPFASSRLSRREITVLVPFVILIFITGLCPMLFFRYSSASLDCLLKRSECSLSLNRSSGSKQAFNGAGDSSKNFKKEGE